MPEQEPHSRIEAKSSVNETLNHRSVELARHSETLENRETSERRVEQAAAEAKEHAQSKEKPAPHEKPKEVSHLSATKTAQQKSYKQTMGTVQTQMSPLSRSFSKVIHNPGVEKASDFIGSTVARPASLLAGSLFAFIAVAGLYITAKFVGFSLTGFETIGTFIIGWILGLCYDFVKVMVSGKR